jgi:hypothetical protein
MVVQETSCHIYRNSVDKKRNKLFYVLLSCSLRDYSLITRKNSQISNYVIYSIEELNT